MAGNGRQLEQRARREALVAVSAKRRARELKEKRLEALAVIVTTGMVQRREIEQRVGEALALMTAVEGLSLREAVEWCDLITVAEARRFCDGSTPGDSERHEA